MILTDELTSEAVFEHANRMTYQGKDRIIMAGRAVIEQALADAGSRRGIKPDTYGCFVMDATYALDRARLRGYVRWELDDNTTEEAIWALTAEGTAIMVSRVDTQKRVRLPLNRVMKWR